MHRALRRAQVAAAATLVALGLGALAQTTAPQAPAAQAPAPQAPAVHGPVAQPAPQPARQAKGPASSPRATVRQVATHPLWRELTPAQQQALTPLSAKWDTLHESQKRKWIALSSNFPRLSAPEQEKLHSRMAEWVNLSAQQRTVARLNFGETKAIPLDDKKAKWEAYQQLPPEEKKRLAAGAAKPPTTAAAVRPVSKDRLATVPRSKSAPHDRPARIAAAPHQLDGNTLLPQHPQPAPPVPANN